MKASLEDYTKALAALAVVPLTISGNVFACYSASTATVQVRFDDGNYVPVLSGLKIKLPAGDGFRKITLQNTSKTTAATVSFYAGTVDLDLTKLT